MSSEVADSRVPVEGRRGARRLAAALRKLVTGPRERRREAALAAAEMAAREAQDQLREAIDVLPEGIVYLDAEGRYILWNERYAEIYTRSADLFRAGEKFEDTLRIGVARGDYPMAKGREEEWLADRLALLANPGVRHEQLLSDGRWIMIEERRTRSGGTIGLRVDITDMKRREASFRLLFEDNPVPMCLLDPETLAIVEANAAACAHYGHDAAAFRSLTLLDLHHPDEHPSLARSSDASPAFRGGRNWRQRRADGSEIEVTTFARALTFENAPRLLFAFVDVTERRRTEARMAHMARHDLLTGLPNRLGYGERIAAAMARAGKLRQGLGVLLIDLDNFKTVNDTLGHSVGDALLKEVADRIRGCLDEDSFVARLGGDEFAVLVPLDQHEGRDEAVARMLLETLAPTFRIDGHQVAAGASIGIARLPEGCTDHEQLLKNATSRSTGRRPRAAAPSAISNRAWTRRCRRAGAWRWTCARPCRVASSRCITSR
ncbi:diguanylate cyclase domain-containing protein [Methylobrevis pamukkalensis]|nr:diguanylate cyclase [Methylobrevis pamukkalensis]